MFCALGRKKLANYSRKFEKVFCMGLTRGGEGHRVSLYTDTERYSYDPNSDTLTFVEPRRTALMTKKEES